MAIRIFLILISLSAFIGQAQAGRRVALVIGNQSYSHLPKLFVAGSDARKVTQLLKSIGFEVISIVDGKKKKMRSALRKFQEQARGAEIALFYYAGHGFQNEGENYLPAIDAGLGKKLLEESLKLQDIIQAAHGGTYRLIFLDACRNSPDISRNIFRRSITSRNGFSMVKSSNANTLIVYATSSGMSAYETKGAPNSYFTSAFLKNFALPQMPLSQVVQNITGEVSVITNNKQVPWSHSSLTTKLVLNNQKTAKKQIKHTINNAFRIRDVQIQTDNQNTQYFVSSHTQLYSAPSEQSQKLGNLPANIIVKATGYLTDGQWIRVKLRSGSEGFVPSVNLKKYKQLARLEENQSSPYSGAALRDCNACPELYFVKPGRFSMGAKTGDSDELPVHDVVIKRGFYIGRYEVTVRQWLACVKAGGCSYKPARMQALDHPVTYVNWKDAQVYLQWLSEKTGHRYRLATEAEWEYAATSAGKKKLAGGSNCRACRGTSSRLQKIGQLSPNQLGLYDVLGNVAEWVRDCQNTSYQYAPVDGSAWLAGQCNRRGVRGGSWYQSRTFSRVSSRSFEDINKRAAYIGFRVVRELD